MKSSYVLVVCGVLIIFGALMVSAAYGATMRVQADILSVPDDNDIIRISVPDFVDLGNVTLYDQSEEVRLWVNNTGTVDIIVEPILLNESDSVFSHLYFRAQKTSNGSSVPRRQIGDFTFEAKKPTVGTDTNPEDIYMILDLQNFTGTLNRNLIDHSAEIYFLAVAA